MVPAQAFDLAHKLADGLLSVPAQQRKHSATCERLLLAAEKDRMAVEARREQAMRQEMDKPLLKDCNLNLQRKKS